MCGISGFLNPARDLPDQQQREIIGRMNGQLEHRGPDDHGCWSDEEAGVALGHTRLAIIDLSQAGHQPAESDCQRYVMSYNGEIYNHRELRRELEAHGVGFRGHSDTETLLAAIRQWGMPGVLPRLNGMFAFALWDRQEQELYLARDRFGEKPLYYGWTNGCFVFASELKALREFPGYSAELDTGALRDFLHFGFITANRSIHQDIAQLAPGHWCVVNGNLPETIGQAWWSPREVVAQGLARPFTGADEEIETRLLEGLRKSVGRRLEADVGLGAFLSGGLDSSLVVALMQEVSANPVRTYTVGFEDRVYDEMEYAAGVAKHLGTVHTEIQVTERDAMALIPELPAIYSEPFADVSMIPTCLINRLARDHVAVCLSGDGGDELFAGYNRHVAAQRLQGILRFLPPVLRRLPASLVASLPDQMFAHGSLGWGSARDKLSKLSALMGATSDLDAYQRVLERWRDVSPLRTDREPGLLEAGVQVPGLAESMMVMDTLNYLPADILVKVDRASMAVALENRVPFLDHQVFELAWRLPARLRIKGNQGKQVLRSLLSRYVPAGLTDRPKMGFSVPLAAWLRGGLRDWAEDLLSENALQASAVFNTPNVRHAWRKHLAGKHDLEQGLWSVLMFQAWYRHQPRDNRG